MGMETLSVNISGKVRRATLNGRAHLVVPLSMIVPGVLNGSKGPLYYPPEEIAKNPGAWNHMPIVVNHSYRNGQPISARDPEVLNNQSIGLILNSVIDSKQRLVGEGWFDIERTRELSTPILMSLNAGKPIELSTGVFTDNEQIDGITDNGKSYSFIARNYRPDHLAILPDSVGACSIQDGCGVLVNEEIVQNGKLLGFTSDNKDHFHSVRIDEDGFGFTSFVDGHSHSINNFKVKSANRHKHSLDQDKLVDTGINTFNNEDNFMNEKQRTEIVDLLVSNCDCWQEDDREVLNSFDDTKLTQLKEHNVKIKAEEIVSNAAIKVFTDPWGNEHTWNAEKKEWETKVKEETKEPVANKKEETPTAYVPPKTTKEWMDSAPPEIQGAVQNAMNIENRERTILVEQIVANLEGDEKQRQMERLQTKSLQELHDTLSLMPKPAVANVEQARQYPTASYLGQATPAANRVPADDLETLELPVMNFNN